MYLGDLATLKYWKCLEGIVNFLSWNSFNFATSESFPNTDIVKEYLFPFALILWNNEQDFAAFKILTITDWKTVSLVKNNFYKVPYLSGWKLYKKGKTWFDQYNFVKQQLILS